MSADSRIFEESRDLGRKESVIVKIGAPKGGLFWSGVIFKKFISWVSWLPWFSWFLKTTEFIVFKKEFIVFKRGCFQVFISWFRGVRGFVECERQKTFNSVQTRCIVKGEAQKSPLFWRFSGGFWFSQDRLFSRNSTRKPLNLYKIPDFYTNTPCKCTCLYSLHLVCTLLICFFFNNDIFDAYRRRRKGQQA